MDLGTTGGGLAAAAPIRVVMTDDDPVLNEMWERYFGQADYPGLQLVTANNYDEIVSALNLPGADPDATIIIGNRDRLSDIAQAKRQVSLRLRIAAFTDLPDEARQDWHTLIELGDGKVFVWNRDELVSGVTWAKMCANLVQHIRQAFA